MISKKTLKEIKDAKVRYENAVQSGFGKDARKREYMNLLFNHSNALLEAVQEAEMLEAQNKEMQGVVDSLMAALDNEKNASKESVADTAVENETAMST